MKRINKLFTFLSILLGTMLIGCGSCSDNTITSIEEEQEKDEIFDIPISSMRLRDPFILVDRENKMYYLHFNDNKKIRVYKSKDLAMWKDEGYAFVADASFWGKNDFWAPDVHKYDGNYYMFTTFSDENGKRGTSILTSDKLNGKFTPLVNAPITPKNWMCLDGSLYIDSEGEPWLLFCHEWLEVKDGEIYAQKLAKDLKGTIGEPKLLFKASEAPWVGPITSGAITGNVTDAPFIHRLEDGRLIMLWSSFRKDGKYAIGQATSASGSIYGPWIQEAETLNSDDGGHAMVFEDLKGRLMISYHSPNSATEHPVIKPIYIKDGKFVPFQ